MINVLIAIKVSDAKDIRDNFGSYSKNVRQALKHLKEGSWKRVKFSLVNYLILDTLLENDNWLPRIETKFPTMKILAAFKPDGYQVGIEVSYDENGDVVLTGTPLYTIPNKLKAALPDIVTYDQNGNETSRTPRTVLSDDGGHIFYGWKKRQWV